MSPEEIDSLTLAVYRRRLNDECAGDADRQLEKHGEDKQRRWSRFYRPSVVATLIELGLHERPKVARKREPAHD